MLKISSLNQFYGESHTLWDINMQVPKGACTCLMGRNGVGKTTLLKCIMGLLEVDSGSVLMGDSELLTEKAEKRAFKGIGYVPQGREIFPLLTVEENLLTGLPARQDSIKDIPALVFELFPVLKQMLHRYGGDLSGGQQQQLAIGRALVIDPQMLILDEPSEGIQPNIVQEIGEIIKHLNQDRGITVLIVEQKLVFARKVADYFCILEKGRVVANGVMSDLSDGLVKQHLSV